ncbi:hypothetical protein Hanom_Chr13g01227161 [Helianthus anomalus]
MRYKEWTDRMTSIESSMAEMKDMMRRMMEHSQSQPSTQKIANELWNSIQPILQAQINLVEINHNTHMELIRNMVDARYKVTQAYIKAIREHLVKTTACAPATVLPYDDEEEDANKGEKDSLRKLQPDSKTKSRPKVQQKSASAQPKSSAKASEAGKQKGIDETLNKKADEISLEKQKKQDTKEYKASSLIKKNRMSKRKRRILALHKGGSLQES